jgi:hypothetical protein
VLCDEVEGGLRRLSGDQRIEHDPASIALDERDVGQVIAAHLIDAVGDLEQPVVHVELGVAPEARIDRIRRRLVRTDVGLVLLQVPDDVALGVPDGERIRFGDQPREASSKACRSLKFNWLCRARLVALVASVAGLGCVPVDCWAVAATEIPSAMVEVNVMKLRLWKPSTPPNAGRRRCGRRQRILGDAR